VGIVDRPRLRVSVFDIPPTANHLHLGFAVAPLRALLSLSAKPPRVLAWTVHNGWALGRGVA
jgi:hypothetical protein